MLVNADPRAHVNTGMNVHPRMRTVWVQEQISVSVRIDTLQICIYQQTASSCHLFVQMTVDNTCDFHAQDSAHCTTLHTHVNEYKEQKILQIKVLRDQLLCIQAGLPTLESDKNVMYR